MSSGPAYAKQEQQTSPAKQHKVRVGKLYSCDRRRLMNRFRAQAEAAAREMPQGQGLIDIRGSSLGNSGKRTNTDHKKAYTPRDACIHKCIQVMFCVFIFVRPPGAYK